MPVKIVVIQRVEVIQYPLEIVVSLLLPLLLTAVVLLVQVRLVLLLAEGDPVEVEQEEVGKIFILLLYCSLLKKRKWKLIQI